MCMETLVLKFGGAALATPEAFSFVARLIKEKRERGIRVVCVVSAMGDTTNELLRLAEKVHHAPPKRELDMLVSAGERVSMSLLAMALDIEGIDAKSFTGSQSGIITSGVHTDATIVDVRPVRIIEALRTHCVPIVAGFQGVSLEKEVTTLGRGGSDTTAVALGIALDAHHVEFYKDVDGFFDADPKLFKEAKLFKNMSFDEAYGYAKSGAKILHSRAISLASKNNLPLHVYPLKPSCKEGCGTVIGVQGSQREQRYYELSITSLESASQ